MRSVQPLRALYGACLLGWSAMTALAFPLIVNVVETGGDNEATDTITAKWTGVTWNCTQANEPINPMVVGTPYLVPLFGEDVPTYVDRAHQWNGATAALPLPSYLVGAEYIMIGNDNRDNASFKLDITVAEDALVYVLVDNRLTDGDAASPPEYGGSLDSWTRMQWLNTEGYQPMLTGWNRAADPNLPDEIGVDEAGNGTGPGGDIQNYSSVYYKQVSAGTFTIYEMNEAGRNMFGVVIRRLPTSVNNPPEFKDITPANDTLFYSAAGGLKFTATTVSPNRIDNANIKVSLNGVDVSADLIIGGTATARTATYAKLSTDTAYLATMTASDQAGRSSEVSIGFDTLNPATVTMVEAEDYTYGGGQIVTPPSVGGYANQTGTAGIDYADHNTTGTTGLYRTTDYVGLAVAADVGRDIFTSIGATDHMVNQVQAGEWLNYAFPFTAGTYAVYLRGSTAVNQRVQLDRVVAGTGTPNQTRQPLGSFGFGPGSPTPFAYAPLTDAAGKPVVVSLANPTTLRLTPQGANYDLNLNYLIFVPTASAARPPYVSVASPAAGATDAVPTSVVTATLVNGTTTVVAGSVTLKFDGADVTSAATVTPTADGATVSYDPPGLLELNSLHTLALAFTDSASGAQTVEWSFRTVATLTVIPANFATAPGSGQGNGFKIKMRKAPDSDAAGAAFTLANNVARAEQQLADLIIDPDTAAPYVNEAAGPNNDGLATATTLNFQQLGTTAGSFAGDQPFPYIDPLVFPDPNNICLEATAYLELAAGVYRFGVRSDDGFQVASRPVLTSPNPNVVLGVLDGGRGDGLPAGATEFEFQVLENGLYPVRLLWWEGNGGASLEFYSVDRTTFKRTLINDRAQADAIKAFTSRTTEIYVPIVSLTSPTEGQVFPTAPADITLKANASEVNGTIVKVEFFDAAGAKLGEDTTAPFELPLGKVYAGRYAVSVRATDAKGWTAAAGPVDYFVGSALVKVNFQLQGGEEPEGYLPDYGFVFADQGNGYSYGWDLDNTASARDRNNARSPDQRYDTFNHLQKPQPAGSLWEIELPNGRYNVFAVVGESDNIDSVYDLTGEGVTIVKGTPTDAVRWYEGQKAIAVKDGRLSIGNGPTAANNKVCFIEVYPLPAEVAPPVFGPPTLAGNTLTVTWTGGGTLQEAADITGPWTNVTGNPQGTYSTSPTAPRKFYRAMVQ